MVDYLERNVAEFASKWKQKFSPESIAQGKDTARSTAIDKRSVSQGIYPMKQAYTDLEIRVNKGAKLATKGKQAMATKAASSNRTMKPTTQRGNLKAAPARNQLSSKSAQSFKTGVQNQATNAKNTRLRNASKTFDSNVKLRGDLEEAINPSKPFNPNESSWAKNANKGIKTEAPKVKVNTIQYKKTSLLGKVGRAIRTNPVAAGAGIGAIGAGIGYGLYKKRKEQNK